MSRTAFDVTPLGCCDRDGDDGWHHQAELEQQQQLTEWNWNMRTSELTTSKYLKQSDVEGEVDVIIDRVTKENVAVPGQPAKSRGVLYFSGFEKGMVLNTTNINKIEKGTKNVKGYGPDTDKWVGKPLVLYVDEEVEFGGEVVGGLRVRIPNGKAAQGPLGDLKDDIPF